MLQFALNYILMPILVLNIVIFVHELGHLLTARYFKMKTPVFSVGFGREIVGFTDKFGTRWKLSIFPLGGYVSVDTLDKQPLYQRTFVAIAGPFANMILAILLMIVVGMSYGIPRTPPLIVAVKIDSGAYAAGIKPHDKIVRLDDKDIPYHIEEITNIVRDAKNDHVVADILRDGKVLTVSIPVRDTSKIDDFGGSMQQRMIGVLFAGQNLKLSSVNQVADVNTHGDINLARAELIKNFGKTITLNLGKGADAENFLTYIDPALNKGLQDENSSKHSTFVFSDNNKIEFVPTSVSDAVADSFDLVYLGCKKTLGVLYQIITGKKDTGDLGGVVAISTMTGEVTEQATIIGPYYIFKFIALLSINIGFINLLPLPMFDGGHLALYAAEGIRGRPLSLKVKGYIYGVGIMSILILSLMIAYRDIMERLNN